MKTLATLIALCLFATPAVAKIDLDERMAEYKFKTVIEATLPIEDTARVIQEYSTLCDSGAGGWQYNVDRLTRIKGQNIIIYIQNPVWLANLEATESGTRITVYTRFDSHMSRLSTHAYRVESIKRWVAEDFTCVE